MIPINLLLHIFWYTICILLSAHDFGIIGHVLLDIKDVVLALIFVFFFFIDSKIILVYVVLLQEMLYFI